MTSDRTSSGFSSVSAVTFDAGGTLLSPWPSVGAIYAEVFAQHGLLVDPERTEAAFRAAWTRRTAASGGRTDERNEVENWRHLVAEVLRVETGGLPGSFDAIFEDLWRAFGEPGRWRVHEGAHETLAELSARGLQLAVLSNWDSRLRPLLEGLELAKYFEAFFISAEIGWEKPAAGIFEAVERGLGVFGGQILHAGDSLRHDCEPAVEAGWQAVWISGGPGSAPKRVRRVSSLAEIPEAVL